MKDYSTSYYGSERDFGSFRRSVPAPSIIPEKDVTVDYEEDVLTVVFAKLETEKPERPGTVPGRLRQERRG